MGLRDFFSKSSSSNNTALDISNEPERKRFELVHDSTKQEGGKKEKLPNALRTVTFGSPIMKSSKQQETASSYGGSIFKLRQKEQKAELAPITHEEIAARAWQIWQQKGCHDGGEVENWLEAEAQLKAERNR